jgi:hypothetical protein
VGDVLSRPWVALGTVCRGSGELLRVEAGDGGACHGDEAVRVSSCSARRVACDMSIGSSKGECVLWGPRALRESGKAFAGAEVVAVESFVTEHQSLSWRRS